jgi:hypothetical protein
MKQQKWYEIDNLEDFTESLRKLVIDSFFEDKDEDHIFKDLFRSKESELEEKLTLEEARLIVNSMVEKNDFKEEYLVSHKAFTKIFNNLNRRIISNILRDLVSAGQIESAFDDDKNDFIFWIKEDQSK